MKVLGVTGGTGAGKTEVCRILQEQGGTIIDADRITRQLQEQGQPVYAEIVSYFGTEILHEDGALDRKKLGGIVFADREKLAALNQIVHRSVSEEIKKQVEAYRREGTVPFVVLDVPIPVEEGFFDIADRIWAVIANDDLRIQRLRSRMGLTEEEAERRIAAQMTNREYEAIADVPIENESGRKDLEKLVILELKRFLAE